MILVKRESFDEWPQAVNCSLRVHSVCFANSRSRCCETKFNQLFPFGLVLNNISFVMVSTSNFNITRYRRTVVYIFSRVLWNKFNHKSSQYRLTESSLSLAWVCFVRTFQLRGTVFSILSCDAICLSPLKINDKKFSFKHWYCVLCLKIPIIEQYGFSKLSCEMKIPIIWAIRYFQNSHAIMFVFCLQIVLLQRGWVM